ncbi:MAG TPA: M55 family metallopeptidase, partial [Gemmatimonadaceae bacterium]|nr:M55 family metallopeptidase [Gemmatimonadaceae bacterium]
MRRPRFPLRSVHKGLRALSAPLATAGIAALVMLVPTGGHAQRPLKVYISADLEGIAGVVTGDQLGPTGFEYGRAREFMTGEVLAAIAGAREAGATEIVVSDSHG